MAGRVRNDRLFQGARRRPNVFGLGERIDEFYVSIQRRRPIEAFGEKCGMDRPEAIADDLRGNVMTCQNTGAKGAHMIGYVAEFDCPRHPHPNEEIGG